VAKRKRLDAELVRRGFAETRAHAAELVALSLVTVGGAPATSPASQIDPAAALHVLDPPSTYFGRGGVKLEAALDRFAIDCNGLWVLDAGSSTGGFTDCVLQRGAMRVVAVDVGRGQLHQRLLTDERVDVRERTDIRNVTPASLQQPVDLIVADISFLALRKVLPTLTDLAAERANLLLLVKPQFEATQAEASLHKGVIRDSAVWLRVLRENGTAVRAAGLGMMGCMKSPITGADGNVEFFVHAQCDAEGLSPDGVDQLLMDTI
jgi:23S rRNA (cytidine1920-2'-O)/16S rRNA (cytidine1409-2'-O)-methyltransferase